MAELALQLRHTPPRLLGRVLENLEHLTTRLAPTGSYPYDWVVHAVTGYDSRPTRGLIDSRPTTGSRDSNLAANSALAAAKLAPCRGHAQRRASEDEDVPTDAAETDAETIVGLVLGLHPTPTPADGPLMLTASPSEPSSGTYAACEGSASPPALLPTQSWPGCALPGKTLLADLNRLAWELAQPAEAAEEPVYSLAEVAERVGVSEKTVTRWRKRGLPARPWAYPDGRIRVAIRHSELVNFLRRNGEQATRAAGLTRLTHEQTRAIIDLARATRTQRTTNEGGTPPIDEVARIVADALGQAIETVRYTLFKHDETFPEEAVFPEALPPLPQAALIAIASAVAQVAAPAPCGPASLKETPSSVEDVLQELARRFRRPMSVIRAAAYEGQVLALLREPVAYIDNPEFRDANAETVIRGEALAVCQAVGTPPTTTRPPTTDAKSASGKRPSRSDRRTPGDRRAPDGTPAYLAHLYETPLLSPFQERALFRLYNYLKFCAATQQDWLRHHPIDHPCRSERVATLQNLLAEAGEVKNIIIRANLRLVVSVAKNHVGPATPLFELVSEGNIALMRALEKFDYARGNRFSTYAVYVISRDFARLLPEEAHWLSQLVSPTESVIADCHAPHDSDDDLPASTSQLGAALEQLSDKERAIISHRFGLTGTDGNAANLAVGLPTLEQLGRTLGVSGERVRQIEKTALLKLRHLLGG